MCVYKNDFAGLTVKSFLSLCIGRYVKLFVAFFWSWILRRVSIHNSDVEMTESSSFRRLHKSLTEFPFFFYESCKTFVCAQVWK